MHGLKHRGITDSNDRASGGYITEAMRQMYNHEIVIPALNVRFWPVAVAWRDSKHIQSARMLSCPTVEMKRQLAF